MPFYFPIHISEYPFLRAFVKVVEDIERARGNATERHRAACGTLHASRALATVLEIAQFVCMPGRDVVVVVAGLVGYLVNGHGLAHVCTNPPVGMDVADVIYIYRVP